MFTFCPILSKEQISCLLVTKLFGPVFLVGGTISLKPEIFKASALKFPIYV